MVSVSEVTCGACGRPVADQAYLCGDCTAKLARDLQEISDGLEEDLDIETTRQANHSNPADEKRRSAETPLPYHVGASNASHDLYSALARWSKLVATERGHDLPAEPVRARPVIPEQRTVRRAPIERCDVSDLPVDGCAHCRPAVDETFLQGLGE